VFRHSAAIAVASLLAVAPSGPAAGMKGKTPELPATGSSLAGPASAEIPNGTTDIYQANDARGVCVTVLSRDDMSVVIDSGSGTEQFTIPRDLTTSLCVPLAVLITLSCPGNSCRSAWRVDGF
jgi:hypothetical protein